MISHLSSMAESRLIISFAPKPWLGLLKKIGSFFPGASKRLAYQHREADVVKILESQGFIIQRQAMTRTHFSRILEATRKS